MSNRTQESIVGCILGTAVGDAIGLPAEGLRRKRLARLYPNVNRHHFVFGRGMVSDDTEHTCMTAQALIASGGDTKLFAKSLAKQLRLWLLMFPAGTGLATAKACIRLCFGFNPERSGVFSAGNGPAMRSAIIGVFCGDDTEKMRELVRTSTRITHTDPKAEYGAFAVALAASLAGREDINPESFGQLLAGLLPPDADELIALVERAASAASSMDTPDFADSLGLQNGVGGYVYHTVPVVLHAWFRYGNDYRNAISKIVSCGGDTDTTAAIVGGIIGSAVGKDEIPKEWLNGILEWPRSAKWMESLASQLANVSKAGRAERILKPSLLGLPLRNLLFLVIVLLHGLRRLLPPY